MKHALSSNPKLVHGFEKQVRAYERGESTDRSFYVIVRVTESESGIKAVRAAEEKAKRTRKRVPRVVVIDGRVRAAASKEQ